MKRLQMPGRHARMPLKDTVPRMVSACMAPGPVGVLRMELQLTTVSSRVIGEKTTLLGAGACEAGKGVPGHVFHGGLGEEG